MSVYSRYKRQPDGFRKLVELLEGTPKERFLKMIKIGMQEDPIYTKKALQYLMTFDDILKLSNDELAELVSHTPARFTAFALLNMDEEVKKRFLTVSLPQARTEIRDYLEAKASDSDIAASKRKLVSVARELEKQGLIKIKHIPENP